MTFDNGLSTKQLSDPFKRGEVTEQIVRVVVQGLITLGVLGAWVASIFSGTTDPNLTTIVFTLIAFWFGQGLLSSFLGVQRAKIEANTASSTNATNATIAAIAAQQPQQPGAAQ